MTGQLNLLPAHFQSAISETQTWTVKGKVIEAIGTIVKAVIPSAKIGEICLLRHPRETECLRAEVVGFAKNAALLTPLGHTEGLTAGMEVIPTGKVLMVPVGEELCGRVLDGLGRPLDGDTKGELKWSTQYPIYAEPPHPLQRSLISKPLTLGVRALDGLLTCGEGQRLGIFAAAGGGKSTLLGQIVKGTEADINVVALIGERGREVREFIERELGPAGLAKSVLVVSTSDRSAMERLKAAYIATAIAEFFRDKGKRVLLLMDSVTRYARALREVGLAAGEPPTRRGYPPSVFSALPRLMERAGTCNQGSITALYTVLVEGDDMTEPIADETRGILDGHIILSRKLATANHYPAIDVLHSTSRVMNHIVTKEHAQAAGRIRSLLNAYEEIELLVRIGEYQQGTDPEADLAIKLKSKIDTFLQQDVKVQASFAATVRDLERLAAARG